MNSGKIKVKKKEEVTDSERLRLLLAQKNGQNQKVDTEILSIFERLENRIENVESMLNT